MKNMLCLCPKCNIVEIKRICRPDTIHGDEIRCPFCNYFFGWNTEGKPFKREIINERKGSNE
jgi:hypothetical protein